MEGLLGQKERQIAWLESVNLSSAQKTDPINYEPGQVVEFRRRAKGEFRSGERWGVSRKEGERVFVTRDGGKSFCRCSNGKRSTSTGRHNADSGRRALAHHKKQPLRKFKERGLRKVAAIDGDRITLDNGYKLNASRPLHIRQGYTITRQTSQGHET